MKSDILRSGLQPRIRLINMFAVVLLICSLATTTLGKTCVSVNCSPDFQIISCDQDGGHDKCEPCPQYKSQPFNISSMGDTTFHNCFGIDPDSCNQTGVIHSRWRDKKTSCRQRCECDVANCYAGETACDCKKYQPCDINQQMNSTTGACVPCPPNKYKDEVGCYPCQYDLNGTRTQYTPGKQTTSHIPEVNKTTRDMDRSSVSTQNTYTVHPKRSTPPTYVVTNRMHDASDEVCVSITVVIILGILLFIICLLVAVLSIKTCRRRRACKSTHFSADTEENQPNSITVTAENSLLLNIKDNNANFARELQTAYQCTEESGVEKRFLQGDEVRGKLNTKKVAGEALDSGYMTQHEGSTSSYPTSYQTSSCPSQNGGISGHCKNLSYLLTETSSPTEHDEESTHVKSISGDD